MVIPFKFRVDRKKIINQPKYFIMQGDKRTNIIEVSIYDGGEPVDLEGKEVVVIFRTPNNKIVEQSTLDLEIPITTFENTVRCIMGKTALQTEGTLEMEITVSEDEYTSFTTHPLSFKVNKRIGDHLPIQEQDDFPTLEALIEVYKKELNELSLLKKDMEKEFEAFRVEQVKLRHDLDNKSFKTWLDLVGGNKT